MDNVEVKQDPNSEKEEDKLLDSYLDKLNPSIKETLENHEIASRECLIYLYLKLPSFIITLVQTHIGLPPLHSANGRPLAKLVRNLQIEEALRQEREIVNTRVMEPYWLRVEAAKKARREMPNKKPWQYYKNNKFREKPMHTIIEKFNIAKMAKAEGMVEVAQREDVALNTMKTWIKNLDKYKKFLDINPLFGNYNCLGDMHLKNYLIGQYAEKYNLKKTMRKYNLGLTRVNVATRWYKDFSGGIFRKVKGTRSNPYNTKIPNAAAEDIEVELSNNGCGGPHEESIKELKIAVQKEIDRWNNYDGHGQPPTPSPTNSDHSLGELFQEEQKSNAVESSKNLVCKIPDVHTDDIKTQGSSTYNYDPPCNKFEEDNEFYADVKNEEITNCMNFDILKEQKEDTNDIKESYSEAQPTEYLAMKLNNEKSLENQKNSSDYYSRREKKEKLIFDKIETRFGIITMKQKLGFSSEELSWIFAGNSRTSIDSLYQTYQKSGSRGIIGNLFQRLAGVPSSQALHELALKVKPAVAECIETAKYKDKIMPQGHDIVKYLSNKGFKRINTGNISKIMRYIGYSYKKARMVVADKNKPSVLHQRTTYFRRFLHNHKKVKEGRGKAEIYLDESFIIDRHVRRFCWVMESSRREKARQRLEFEEERPAPEYSQKLQNSVGVNSFRKYHQVCIVGAIEYNGWLGVDYDNLEEDLIKSEKKGVYKSGSIMYFKVENSEEKEVHLSFNKELFSEYFLTQFIPSLDKSPRTSKGSYIIMDQCAYHTPPHEQSFNPRKATRGELMEWLLREGQRVSPHTPIQQLRTQVVELGGSPHTYLEDLLDMYYKDKGKGKGKYKHKHKILFLPPYHPELNPIEICWGILKNPILSRYIVLDPDLVCREDLPRRFPSIDKGKVGKLYDRLDDVVLPQYGDPMLPSKDYRPSILTSVRLLMKEWNM